MEYQPYQPTQEEIDNPPFNWGRFLVRLLGCFFIFCALSTIAYNIPGFSEPIGDGFQGTPYAIFCALMFKIPTVIMWLFGEWRHPQKPLVDLFASYPSDYDYTVEDFR